MKLGAPHRWTAVLSGEVRRTLSTRLWWLLLIPVVLLALAMSLFGSLITLLVPAATDTSAILMLTGLASALSMTAIIGAAFGALLAAGEYRHRTITLAFLTGSRIQVLGGKVVVAAVVAAAYGLVVAVLGPLLGGAVLGGQQLPTWGQLAGLGAVGVLVCALWGVLGVAVGTLVPNQPGAVSLTVGYLLIGENVVSAALQAGGSPSGDPSVFARITPFLPGNAGDLALYEAPVSAAGTDARTVLEFLAGVSAPPPGWVALLVLAAWAVAGVALAVVVGGRRDIT
ncbi:putative ABC transport system membrane protein [Pseudonocardia sp. Ae168_Ps1]|jgi:ABC-2 type transport system permease protein|uniref:ABC transporter permease n=1 Tax=unclassified Pseudonocardia TaxID=2619320 RepID=UPI0001FFE5A4|nr:MULTISPECIES: ABC transporter permease [unclassified Pseudonocardia]ALE72374.1 hypothetical protein FRP1_03135 [Pseudonocardia sp. EC080625-04]ALL75668.1 hypothetical protein AD006_10745 [Pseudonocardia sp. EC080610-09]ALL82696.1 hypothetical protein AD017_18575 [Pseudonocardia sp. EC080619-01]OLL73859.1 putative ABC transport system membrane protein [Pseudonocardia sp. Ae150A_Ps1]OLL79839.1 putative ABC transport system membrane protein [Pseudonocardia sp. Ae168_Ps1]